MAILPVNQMNQTVASWNCRLIKQCKSLMSFVCVYVSDRTTDLLKSKIVNENFISRHPVGR